MPLNLRVRTEYFQTLVYLSPFTPSSLLIMLLRLIDCIISSLQFPKSIYYILRQYNAYLDWSLTLDFAALRVSVSDHCLNSVIRLNKGRFRTHLGCWQNIQQADIAKVLIGLKTFPLNLFFAQWLFLYKARWYSKVVKKVLYSIVLFSTHPTV